MSEEKIYKKIAISQIFFFLVGYFFADFAHFFDGNTTDLVKKNSTLFGMSEEKIKKTHKCQLFFFFCLVGHIFSPSEELWTKEYSECCLKGFSFYDPI